MITLKLLNHLFIITRNIFSLSCLRYQQGPLFSVVGGIAGVWGEEEVGKAGEGEGEGETVGLQWGWQFQMVGG